MLLLLLFACQDPPAKDGPLDSADSADSADSGDSPRGDSGPTGFIGSPCVSDADCPYEGGVCLTEGFPGGTCSLSCERLCPDADGYPVTFCVDAGELPPGTPLDEGACLSRCDFGLYPEGGCREDYGCVVVPRANEPETENYACLPNRRDELSRCYDELAAMGVAFEPTVIAEDHPSDYPNLTCSIQDAVYILGPVHGVDLRYYDGSPTPRVLAACAMAQALTDTIDDVAALGVSTLTHIGTYNCRVIEGTSTLSRHAYGDAIDIYGFTFEDGTTYTLVDDWEHDTTDPVGEGAQFLYDAAYRWHDAQLWNIILTPNYNDAHDNHFHVDLTPGSDYIGFLGAFWIGPAPYRD